MEQIERNNFIKILKEKYRWKYKEIAVRFGISKQRVHQIIKDYRNRRNLPPKKRLITFKSSYRLLETEGDCYYVQSKKTGKIHLMNIPNHETKTI